MRKLNKNIIRKNNLRVDAKALESQIDEYLQNIKNALVVKRISNTKKEVILFVQTKQGEECTKKELVAHIKNAEIIDQIIPVSTMPLEKEGNINYALLEKLNIADVEKIKETCNYQNDEDCIVLYTENYIKSQPVHIKDVIINKNDKKMKRKR